MVDYDVTITFVNVFNEQEVKAFIQDNTKTIFIETLGNSNSDVADVKSPMIRPTSAPIPAYGGGASELGYQAKYNLVID